MIEHNIETIVVEYNLKDNRNKILYELYHHNADVYGFSVYIWNVDMIKPLAEDLKKLLPECRIIFGGPEVSFDDDVPFYIDHIIKGEGENVIADLCLNPSAYGKIVQAEQYDGFIDDGIFYDTVPVTQGNMLYYESSRGCPYNCSYCLSSAIHGVRMKSADKTIGDINRFESLANEIKVIKFVDRTFNCDINRAKRIWHELLNDEYKLTYHFEICADLLDDKSFTIISALPDNRIQLEIGIQSTNPETLRSINRKSDITKALINLERLHSLGNIHVHADLIAGLPYETYDIFKKSFNDVYGKCDMLQLGFLKLLKGTCIRCDSDKWNYKYMTNAPYTVLSNDFISYDELMKLQEIESVLNRFGNSGRFTKSIEYLISVSPSPFDFYENLSQFVSDLPNFSQIKAYELLHSYAIAQYPVNEIDADMLKSYLTFDFLMNESVSCPQSIRYNMIEHKNLYRFKFDPEHIYSFDRKNRSYNVKRSV